MINFTRSLFVSLLLPLLAASQPALTVAGYGYRTPSNAIEGAPGQVLNVSVSGAKVRLAAPIQPEPGIAGLPTVVQGLSLRFRQEALDRILPIRYVQQSPCPASGACSPITTFTFQLPDEISLDALAFVEVREGESVFAEAVVRTVTDNIHVLNTCDQTGTWIGIAADVPTDTCAPIVAHANGSLVSPAAPAKAGETLVIWAYGLGALDRAYPANCCQTPDQLPLAVQPFNVSFVYPGANRTTFRRLTQVTPVYTGMVGGGFYQVHFVMPALPEGLRACDSFSGNLRALLSGPASSDSLALCASY